MTHRLKSLLAYWFVLQLVLPFAPPSQICDLRDLLGTRRDRVPFSQESSTATPAGEADAEANLFEPPLEVSMLSASASLVVCETAAATSDVIAFDLQSSPNVQQKVLRL